MSKVFEIQKLEQTIEQVRSIGLTAPAFGDGDSVGTQCALREMFLAKFSHLKEVRIVNETPCPRRYRFLEQAEFFEISDALLQEPKESWPELMICVDGNYERVGEKTEQLWKAARFRGQIDHHAISGDNVYHLRLYNPEASSTTSIVFDLLNEWKLKLTPTIAEALYVGLIFDTGLFKHSNTRPHTLRMAAELLTTGFNHTEAAERTLLIRSPEAFRLLQHVISQAKFSHNNRYVWSCLRNSEFVGAGADIDDKEGLIDQLFLTDACEIAAFYFEYEPKVWKVSFRARKNHDVASLARSLNPGGGGHKKAAGCTLEGAEAQILSLCHTSVGTLLQ